MRTVVLLVLCLLLNQFTLKAQQLGFLYERIDELFENFNQHESPGYALGIISHGELVYAKGYGKANLEYNIPLSDSSAFYIGSMAKQFTTAALLILESRGKIDLNKPVNQYLSEFPQYEHEITINHLIHHTSGIRETNSLQLFQGIDPKFEEVFDTEDLYELILAQEVLNFKTGEEFRYSSGGYAVLALLVERVSKMPFRAFLDKNIFSPLGMENTFVCDDHNEIVKNRAVSYWPIGNGSYERRSQVFDAYGDGGIITTVKDLVKWDAAFYDDKLGVKGFSSKMYQKGRLNNGDEIEYARALQVRNYKGLQMITHNGGMLGFRVDMVRFPEVKTSFILLGNSAFLDPTGDILKVADLYLKSEFKEVVKIEQGDQHETEIKVDSNILNQYVGYYWTDDTNYFRRISKKQDSLFLDNGNQDYAQYLMPLGDGEYSIKDFYLPNRLNFNPDNKGEELVATFGSSKRRFRKFNPQPPVSLEELRAYTGKYYSKELSSTYSIFIESEVAFLQINNSKPVQIFPLLQNSRFVWNGRKMLWIGFGEVKFVINENNTVTGFEIGDGRVSGVRFTKQH